MLKYLKLLFATKNQYPTLMRDACRNRDLVYLKQIVKSKKLLKAQKYDVFDRLYDAINDKDFDVLKIFIENRKSDFTNTHDNKDLLAHAISKSNREYFDYLFSSLSLEYSDMQGLFYTAISTYRISDDNKKIFEFLYEICYNIEYDNFYAVKMTMYSNYQCSELFDRFISSDRFKIYANKDSLSDLIENTVRNGYIDYFKKLVDLNLIDLGKNKNELLKFSIQLSNDSVALLLLDNKDVIDKYHRPSLQTCLLECIKQHYPTVNKFRIINKILSLKFIDISYDNNQALILAVKLGKLDMIDFILNHKDLDLSKYDDDFSIINDLEDIKIVKKIMNIEPFRKYMNSRLEFDIKPRYKTRKNKRTLND